ncbi:MAG: aldolase/citrate lyase family protein [Flammeovirgaceae bacterium]
MELKKVLLTQKNGTNVKLRSILVLKPTDQSYHKALSCQSDSYLMDMEDAIPLPHKKEARSFMKAQLHGSFAQQFVASQQTLILRVNGLNHKEELLQDIAQLLHPAITHLILPMINTVNDLAVFEELVSNKEADLGLPQGYFSFLPVLETPAGILNAYAIAKGNQRNCALILGHNDLLTELNGNDSWETVVWARQMLIYAARAAGIMPIDTPYHKLDRPNGFIKECESAKALGFEGKILIHVNQVHLANTIFSPSLPQYQWAKHVTKAQQAGKSSLSSRWKGRYFIGPPHIKQAEAILQQSHHRSNMQQETSIVGKMIEGGFDVKSLESGAVVHSSLELTVDHSWATLWNAAFFNTQRINTSRAFAQSIALKDRIIPYSLLLTLVGGMSVSKFSETGKLHLGLTDVRYYRPVYAEDTLHNYFRVVSIRTTTSGQNSVVKSLHILRNQQQEVVFRFTKLTLFPKLAEYQADHVDSSTYAFDAPMQLRTQILKQPIEALRPKHEPQPSLAVGQLFIHRFIKVFEGSEVRQLATLLRLTNPHHYDNQQFDDEDIVVPGPFSIAASLTAPLHDLGEILDQEIVQCSNINMVNYGDSLGALSYIADIQPLTAQPDLEEVTVITLGIKNLDMRLLADYALPQELFSTNWLKPSEIEQICTTHCPDLQHRIACKTVRKVLRIRG